MTKSNRTTDPRHAWDLTQEKLTELLPGIRDGRTQLSHFHRDWCWSSDRVRLFLASIALRHPVGSVTITPPNGVTTRPFEGAAPTCDPEMLVLDGRQRLTAAYKACYCSDPVEINEAGQVEHRLYFFNMEKALLADVPMEEAILSIVVNPDGSALHKSRIDLTVPLSQYEHGVFPVSLIFNFAEYDQPYRKFWSDAGRKAGRSMACETIDYFRSTVVASFEGYKIPVVRMKKAMSIKSMCRTYETLNLHRNSKAA